MDCVLITSLAAKLMKHKDDVNKRGKGYVFYHGQRVANLALSLRKSLFTEDSSDDDIIYVGALFNDIERESEDHNIAS
jgi:uncharacterized protein